MTQALFRESMDQHRIQSGPQNTEEFDFYQIKGRGIPFPLVQEVLDYLPYAHPVRVGLKLLHYTGSRLSELHTMRRSLLFGNMLIWFCGKNQKGKKRKEYLPSDFLSELETYWRRNRLAEDQLFAWKGTTLLRYFNRDVRPQLSHDWRIKVPDVQASHLRGQQQYKIKYEFKYQLKGFRKNFATMLFYHYNEEFSGSDLPIQLTSKRMSHNSTGITAQHYMLCAKEINAQKYKHLYIFQVIRNVRQRRILEYFEGA